MSRRDRVCSPIDVRPQPLSSRYRVTFAPFRPADGGGDAVLNWEEFGLLDFLAYSTGYRRAAEAIWEELGPRARTGHFADYEFCPPIFLLRHAVELGLKHALLYARGVDRLNGGSPAFDDLLLQKHRLKPFWEELLNHLTRSALIDACGTAKLLSKHTATIDSIESVDRESYTFRYPLNTQAALSLPQHFRFSPTNTYLALHELAEHLEYLGHEIGEWFDEMFHERLETHGYPEDPVLLRLRPRE